jgi:hypothetical protein
VPWKLDIVPLRLSWESTFDYNSNTAFSFPDYVNFRRLPDGPDLRGSVSVVSRKWNICKQAENPRPLNESSSLSVWLYVVRSFSRLKDKTPERKETGASLSVMDSGMVSRGSGERRCSFVIAAQMSDFFAEQAE